MTQTPRNYMPSPTNSHTFDVKQELSLYIPYVYSTEDEIINTFKTLELGIVKRVDLVSRGLDTTNNMAFIHMEYWNETQLVENLQKKIISTDMEARVIYDDPKYWILLPNKNPIVNKPTEEIENLKTEIANLRDIIGELTESLSQVKLDNKNTTWVTKLHDANIKYMCDEIASIKFHNNYNTEPHKYENNFSENANHLDVVVHEDRDNFDDEYHSDDKNNKHIYTPRDLWMRRLRPRFTE